MNFIDTERVILEVQCRPVLWDMSNELYKDRDARQAAWLEICRELYENFEDLSEAEKKTTERRIQARWKTARDCYTKVKANNKKLQSRRSGPKKRKGYGYSNIMTFLDSNTSVAGQDPLENVSEEDSSTDTGTVDVSQLPVHDASEFAIPELTVTPEMASVATPYTKKRRIPATSTSERENDTASRETPSQSQFESQSENDEDLSFFKSIMPNIKKLSSYQKLVFRSKVLNVLIDMERENVIKLEDCDHK